MGVCTPADSKVRVGDAPVRPEKRPGDSNQDVGGEGTYREPNWTERLLLGPTCSKLV